MFAEKMFVQKRLRDRRWQPGFIESVVQCGLRDLFQHDGVMRRFGHRLAPGKRRVTRCQYPAGICGGSDLPESPHDGVAGVGFVSFLDLGAASRCPVTGTAP